MSWFARIALTIRVMGYSLKQRLNRPVSVEEAFARLADYMLLVAQELHAAGDHDYENDVYHLGQAWADSSGEFYPSKEATLDMMRRLGEIVEKAESRRAAASSTVEA